MKRLDPSQLASVRLHAFDVVVLVIVGIPGEDSFLVLRQGLLDQFQVILRQSKPGCTYLVPAMTCWTAPCTSV